MRGLVPSRRSAGACLCVGAALLACGGPLETGPEVTRLEHGRLLIESTLAAAPSNDDPRWSPVTLPDAWDPARAQKGGLGWYRFHVPGPARPEGRWAIYLPAVNMTADAFVNGHSVGSGGSLVPPVARNFSRPLYFVFPASLLTAPDNQVDVVLSGVRYNLPSVDRFWIGPDEALRPRYEVDHLFRDSVPLMETFLSLLMAGLMLALWLSSAEKVYGSYTLVSLLHAVASLNYWVREPPMDFWSWERLMHAAVFNFVVAVAVWARHLMDVDAPRTVRGLLVLGVVMNTIILVLPVPIFLHTVLRLHCVTFAVAVSGCWVLVTRMHTLPPGERAIYIISSVLTVLVGAHDMALNLGWAGAGAPYLFPHEAPLFVLAFGASLVRRFAHSLRQAEELGRTLERRVEEKRLQLEEGFRKLRELEHGQLLTTERERMIREMHDGLGSQLTSALTLIERGGGESGDLPRVLRGALDEMRLVIGTLDSESRNVAQMLGVLRPRMQPILAAAGIELVWRIDGMERFRRVGPEDSLHIVRVVQEAIANIIKHANATRVEVGLHLDGEEPPNAVVSVADNGRGFSNGGVESGLGLSHMKQRAAALGGTLDVDSTTAGTRLTLRLPAAPPQQAVNPDGGARGQSG